MGAGGALVDNADGNKFTSSCDPGLSIAIRTFTKGLSILISIQGSYKLGFGIGTSASSKT